MEGGKKSNQHTQRNMEGANTWLLRQGRPKGNKIILNLKYKKKVYQYQPRTLHPAKYSTKHEGKIKMFLDNKIKRLMLTNLLIIQKYLKMAFRIKINGTRRYLRKKLKSQKW